ncbi:DNA alkylation repair protein [Mobilicoccus pelagius]|uniref:DNA alkylation repair enzyme n=1 Tax=Mobilicoccus pelagius NBRC 104925 TaxID=1089455 RepID=H5UT07_9MICO|nr:DNA alkylation repair protein [Mobilicoccus pelagius]GAB48865.1 hypothetical protein MOPEL_083_00700 [Mobilicoccus pelagius NBRC 104925]
MFDVAHAVEQAIRSDLDEHRDPVRARRISRERGRDLPVLGVPDPDVIRIVARVTRDPARRPHDEATWAEAVHRLWTNDPTLESRYAAVALACRPRYRTYAGTPRSTELYRRLIEDHPSVATVDAVATCCLPLPLDARPTTETPVVRSWAVVGSPWLRRASIICQVRRRRRTDPDLLRAAVVANLLDRRAMIRDSIPRAVRAYVEAVPHAAPRVRATLEEWRPLVSRHLVTALEAALHPAPRTDTGRHVGARGTESDDRDGHRSTDDADGHGQHGEAVMPTPRASGRNAPS